MTYKCNHRCLFCSCPWEADSPNAPVYEPGDELTIEQWERALAVLWEAGVTQLSISGGEALLKEGLLDFLRYIREKTGFNQASEIVLISNGRAMNERFLDEFKKLRIHLSLSLPGLSTFALHTGNDDGGAENVLYWLSRARDAGIGTTVNITVTALNFHEFYETIANGLISGADTVLLNRFLPGGRGLSHKDELSLTNDQLNATLETAENTLAKSKRKGSVGTEIPLCVLKSGKERFTHLRVGSLCSAAKDFFAIDPGGYVRVCNHSPVRVGHIFDREFISDSSYWRKFTDRAYLPADCIQCPQVSHCDGGCREAAAICYGEPGAKDPCLAGWNQAKRRFTCCLCDTGSM
jgi:radical SAM protein with 4Fe4S-binding SPASM domain